jgi:hypothetical protein
MRFGPRLAALATVLALPLGATVFANALADEQPPSAPGDVRIGSDPSPAGAEATTTAPPPTTTSPVTTAPKTTVVPPPPPVSDDDDHDDGSGGDDDGDDG